MKIIDNKKDYYDYIVSVWGEDEKVVYDRRGSVPIGERLQPFSDVFCTHLDRWHKPLLKERTKWSVQYPPNIVKAKEISYNDKILEGEVYFICLEVGYWHHYYAVHCYCNEGDSQVSIEHVLVSSQRDDFHVNDKCPLTLYMCNNKYGWPNREGELRINEKKCVENPILSNTWIRKELSAEDIWQQIYEYISSLNDKKSIPDTRTNEQKLESYGFDKKSSFRNIK